MMVASPDWWRIHVPDQYKIIDPATLPPSPELEGLSWDGGLCRERSPEAFYVKQHRSGYVGWLPGSEALGSPEYWRPEHAGYRSVEALLPD
jgi:hypothetical protein